MKPAALYYRMLQYQPENLERGDEVQIDIRDVGGRLLAEEILVVADARGR